MASALLWHDLKPDLGLRLQAVGARGNRTCGKPCRALIVDHATAPSTDETRLQCAIETWLGSELLESYPIFIATDRFVEVVTAAR